MDVHMKRCRPGADRIKRGLERFDLLKHHDTLKYDEKSKKEEGPGESKNNVNYNLNNIYIFVKKIYIYIHFHK